MLSFPVTGRFKTTPLAARRRSSNLLGRMLALAVLTCACGSLSAQSLLPAKIAPSISTFAGTGTPGFSGDGAAASAAQLNAPQGGVFNAAGDLFFSDTLNNRVRKVTALTGVVSTVAGTGVAGYNGEGLAAASTQLNHPVGLAVDRLGNLYIADSGNNRIRMMTAATGVVTTIAGAGLPAFTGDGLAATLATLNNPLGVMLDYTGNVYIADTNNNRIRKIAAGASTITTIAGSGAAGAGTGTFSGDNGSPTSATLSAPVATAVDYQGNLFIADSGNHRVREIVAGTSVISTVAGNGTAVSGGDGGDPLSAGFASITGLAVTAIHTNSYDYPFDIVTTTLYIADGAANRIRATLVPGGPISTVAGTGTPGTTGDGGLASAALLSGPSGLAMDHFGNLYVADTGNNRLRKLPLQGPFLFPTKNVGTAAATQNVYLQLNVAGSISSIQVPPAAGGVQEYTIGTVTGCVVDGTTLNAAGTICTVPITFKPAFPGVRSAPLQIAVARYNVAQRVQGSATFGLTGTGVGPLAALSPGTRTVVLGPTLSSANGGVLAPVCAVPDSAGNLFICDDVRAGTSGLVLKIDAVTSALSIVAGTPNLTYDTSDGVLATGTGLYKVKSIAVNTQGDIYIASDKEVRKVLASDGEIDAAVSSYAAIVTDAPLGDGGLATAAATDPGAIALDTAGNLYVADGSKNRIRRVDTGTGIITTFAGTGTGGFSGDGGPAGLAQLSGAAGVVVDPSGNVYFSDTGNQRVRRVDAVTGVITTVIGNGTAAFSGDGGPASSAQVSAPRQLWLDIPGNLYIADTGNQRVRRVDAATGIISTVLGGSIPFAAAGTTPLSTAYGVADIPTSVAVDGAGNIYVPNNLFDYNGNSHGQVFKLAAASGTLLYPTPIIPGSYDSADNPKTATLANIGNAPLVLSTAASGTNPTAPPAGWTLDNSSTCPTLSTLTVPFALAPGASCGYAYDFQPVSADNTTGTVQVSDNSTTGSQQTINLLGAATSSAVTTTTLGLTYTPVANTNIGPEPYFNSTFTFTVNVSHLAVNATGAISGTVAIYNNGTALPGATGTVTNGSATVVTTNIAPGNDVFTAVFTPAGSDLNASTSNGYSVYVSQRYPSVGVTKTTYVYDGNPHTVAVSVSPSNIPYTVYYRNDDLNYYSSTPPSHAGTYDVYVAVGPDPDYGGTGDYVGYLVITGVPATITFSNLNFVYDGNPHSPTVTTVPAGTAYTLSYFAPGSTTGGTSTPPSAVGAYTVYANISQQTNYTGNAHATMVISANTSSVWIVNQDSTVARLSMTGSVLATAGSPSGSSTFGGIAIDSAGSAWSVANASNTVLQVSKAGVLSGSFTGGGLNAPVAIAVDGLGQKWIVNSNNTLSAFSNTGTAVSPSTGYQATTVGQATALNAPRAIAIDATGSVWLANSGGSTVTRVFGAAAPVLTPTAVAVANSTLGSRP